MNKGFYQISIDTGGTFTDCLASDKEGREYRLKVLSKGTLRGNIIEIIDLQTLKINESWGLQKDIVQGYRFQVLQHIHPEVYIESYDIKNRYLRLSKTLNLSQDKNPSFEIGAGEEAPILAARLLTQTPLNQAFPLIEMKLGSTKGTNALLESKGAKTAFFVSKGFKDLLKIGTQQRPDIFALEIIKPEPLYASVLEIDERISTEGIILKPFVLPDKKVLTKLKKQGIQSIAITLLNAYKNPVHEQELKNYLKEQGFEYISLSTELSNQIKFLQRAETAVVNAYLSPIIGQYLQGIEAKISKESQIKVISSAGSLLKSSAFEAKDSLLSGPAGGIVGAAQIGKLSGFEQLITFDMGGTSTDVARYDGDFDYRFELKVGNAHIFSPALNIETVAAGGGSLCYFDGFKLCVGPQSGGAFPGPACYGAGGDLTLTDVNLLLGRIDTSQISIPILPAEAEKKLEELLETIEKKSGEKSDKEAVLQGFIHIANETMAGAIKKISLAKGYNPADYALLAFGGAGGLHACSIADLLNIKTILIPKDAGVLSAFGISKALTERFREKQFLQSFEFLKKDLKAHFRTLEKEALSELKKEGFRKNQIEIKKRLLYLRLKGQDFSMEIDFEDEKETIKNFKTKYEKIYGYGIDKQEIEIESIKLIASEKPKPLNPPKSPEGGLKESGFGRDELAEGVLVDEFLHNNPLKRDEENPLPSGRTEWQIPIFFRENLKIGVIVRGPALVPDKYSSTFIEEGWELRIDERETGILTKTATGIIAKKKKIDSAKNQETELELFTNRFKYIAENMGAMLQRTSLSVNVKERLDFSCALLDTKGELIANAPHIPVHLGSLGICVRSLIPHIHMEAGDTLISNHPKFGGSHLPDITLVTPVYTTQNQLIGYVVNRAHHAEMGGIRPASMPPDARNLAEEGVVISPFHLVKKGLVQWEKIKEILTKNPYPSRAVEENLADLSAALAANNNGVEALKELAERYGLEKVQLYMNLLKDYASRKMKEVLEKIPKGAYTAEEFLDDGSPLKVKLQIQDKKVSIDFNGSAPSHQGNLNANTAIVGSVVIYVLRLLLKENIPLNEGIMKAVQIIIPEKSILNPDFPDNPEDCPAVVGGNVETSQRLTDTLLKAFGIVACSQGTMNNLLFGNESFSYYETICGGCGAGADFDGADAVHNHMTNTRITDPEIMEFRYPVRVERFEIRKNSGGKGRQKGGNGIIRQITFLSPVSLSVLTQHRKEAPYGVQGGASGKRGTQYIIRKNGKLEKLEGNDGAEMMEGDSIVIKTPGGGGFGKA